MIVHLNSHFNVSVSRHERSATSANQNSDKARETIKEEPNKLMSSEGKYICPECSKCYPNTKALQRHVRDQHKRKVEAVVGPGRHLKGICVDFDKGIFMISRTFSGIMHPIHCQHKTNAPYDSKPVTSSCEIDECMDAARVARRSGHPAFECIHLQSVQYARPVESPVFLSDESLEEIVGGRLKWFTNKQKDMCLVHRERAKKDNSPLVVRFPNDAYGTHSSRTVYLSVYDGAVHYWSRIGRVVVSFDSQTGKWSCRCCRSKVPCIHKAASKWFLYQENKSLIESIPEESEDELEIAAEEADDEIDVTISPNLKPSSVYPPSGRGVEVMTTYHIQHKRIPATLPREHLDGFPSVLVPKEGECHECKIPLSGPYEITARAMIIGVTNVIKGKKQTCPFWL